MNKDILICGVGGQGTVLASRIIAAAAISLEYALPKLPLLSTKGWLSASLPLARRTIVS